MCKTELDYVFAVPTRTHMRYQVGTVAPYWFKTFVLRRKGLTPPQLYRFEHHNATADTNGHYAGESHSPVDEETLAK